MPMSRRNKAPPCPADFQHQPWFHANRKRQRRRAKLARLSRQVQRRIAKGKQR